MTKVIYTFGGNFRTIKTDDSYTGMNELTSGDTSTTVNNFNDVAGTMSEETGDATHFDISTPELQDKQFTWRALTDQQFHF